MKRDDDKDTGSGMPSVADRFPPRLFEFLEDLTANNDRDWFHAHKEDFEHALREPFCTFIAALAPRMKEVSEHFSVDPRPHGGSLFRIHRDVRFSADKRPYKTHAAAHFRHRRGRDVHAPGYYLHLEPGQIFAGAGIWRPPKEALKSIREAIDQHPRAWERTRQELEKQGLSLAGDSLKRPPRGFAADHPLIEDLKRKDFTVDRAYPVQQVQSPGFLDRYVEFCRDALPLQRFLADALGLEV